ncbi:uncharacterized protein CC84DRAFT_1160669 [Paraphaeosphaeria sporulosa]|uniref:Uncharacterized protein n=1 Tax=Paraphaeosphaeria sporulosa TaxID=1460663 RepID=A0A177CRE2_9PLEO|nr:uncharacterized protein CC84DRAFT_1160669 [Paraphaeosphaeria sporulosa]OAG09538.1 hypothetical protein CC84DRAFT_1160669 [Paraphaeosphaeria sporulosa]
MHKRESLLKPQQDAEIFEVSASFSLDDFLNSPRYSITRRAFFVLSNVAHMLCIIALYLSYRNNRACT